MRSHRRGPLEHVLVAADASEVDAVRSLLALLPPAAYGQVYVETDGAAVPTLAAPPRVTITLLPRRQDDAPGARLALAVDGWLAEWQPEEDDPSRSLTMWVGADTRISTSALCLERL